MADDTPRDPLAALRKDRDSYVDAIDRAYADAYNEALDDARTTLDATRPSGDDLVTCAAIWNGCTCARRPHPGDDHHVWRNTLDGDFVDPARYPRPSGDEAPMPPDFGPRPLSSHERQVKEALRHMQTCPSGDEALRKAALAYISHIDSPPERLGGHADNDGCYTAFEDAALATTSSAPDVEGRHNHGTVWPACPACGTSAPDPNFPDHELVDKIDAEFH